MGGGKLKEKPIEGIKGERINKSGEKRGCITPTQGKIRPITWNIGSDRLQRRRHLYWLPQLRTFKCAPIWLKGELTIRCVRFVCSRSNSSLSLHTYNRVTKFIQWFTNFRTPLHKHPFSRQPSSYVPLTHSVSKENRCVWQDLTGFYWIFYIIKKIWRL